jgi:hypothetical protein
VPDAPNLVLLVGAPRSGTTWLQTILAHHPTVASPQETDLFRRYLEPLGEAWRWQQRGGVRAWADRRFKGLPAVLTNDEFDEVTRDYAAAILRKALALRPGASIVLEKSPSTSLCAETIAQLTPHARVVHLIRDGRDVAASLLAASEGWGRWWAPRSLPQAARSWVTHVQGARRAADLRLPYLEVRYEALVQRDVSVLREVHEFCGIDLTGQQCGALYEEFSFQRMADATEAGLLVGGEFGPYAKDRVEPEGFYRSGKVAGWSDDWSAHDRLVFDTIAGALLVDLGYEINHRWAADPMRSRAYRYQALAAAAVASSTGWIGRRGERIAQRMPRR